MVCGFDVGILPAWAHVYRKMANCQADRVRALHAKYADDKDAVLTEEGVHFVGPGGRIEDEAEHMSRLAHNCRVRFNRSVTGLGFKKSSICILCKPPIRYHYFDFYVEIYPCKNMSNTMICSQCWSNMWLVSELPGQRTCFFQWLL